jgi:hypothetical protein
MDPRYIFLNRTESGATLWPGFAFEFAPTISNFSAWMPGFASKVPRSKSKGVGVDA